MTDITTNTRQTFIGPADAYDRLMGRYLPTLAPAFADAAGIVAGMRVLDVGSGPGGLTRELAGRTGADSVWAIDPSPPFLEACRQRFPGVHVREGVAEHLPYEDHRFDATLASLVIGFMDDPEAGAQEMARVTRPGGVVAACFWDRARMPALGIFYSAAASLDPSVPGEIDRFGSGQGEIAEVLALAGLSNVERGEIQARAGYESFDDWWTPFTLGIGPAGAYCRSLDDERRERLRAACQDRLGHPDGPFWLDAHAWFARGVA